MFAIRKEYLATTILALLLVVMPVRAGEQTKEEQTAEYLLKPVSDDFQRLAGLVGVWRGTKENPDGSEMDVEVEYCLSSGKSALVERLFRGSPAEMLSVYHDDGDGLMMTHYCGLGNQPRMRATDGFHDDHIHFHFVDGSNMESPDDAHMHALTITILGDHKIQHDWAMYKGGQQAETVSFVLTRQP